MASFDCPSPPIESAPPIKLTTSKRRALLACLAGDGALYRCGGAWRSSIPSNDPISGITVSDLIRDGLMVPSPTDRLAPAQLTLLGKWYAHSFARERRRAGSAPSQEGAAITQKIISS